MIIPNLCPFCHNRLEESAFSSEHHHTITCPQCIYVDKYRFSLRYYNDILSEIQIIPDTVALILYLSDQLQALYQVERVEYSETKTSFIAEAPLSDLDLSSIEEVKRRISFMLTFL